MDFSKLHSTENISGVDIRERIDGFISRLRSSQTEKGVVVNLKTKNGSKLVDMRVLQIVGDTIYLTDAFETMAIIDFSHIQLMELVD